MDRWTSAHAERIADRAPEELAALVALSTPSGDVAAAEAAVSVVTAMLPAGASIERVACSTPGSAPDLVARVTGDGTRRLLLVGHLDTVVAHAAHRPLTVEGDRLVGSGSVDMKGGDVLAVGVLRALAEDPPAPFAEVALLLVNDEEWRTVPFAHGERFADVDACLCFEAGQLTPGGDEAVVVRRKAAGTLRVRATGRSAHSGSAPHKGANALLALAAAAQAAAAQAAPLDGPPGPDALTVVPTVLRAGDAFNVVPAAGELTCDLRAPDLAAFDRVLAALPAEVGGATLEPALLRRWPGMDARAAAAPLLAAAGERAGRLIAGASRGGASDASHFAAAGVPLVVDGLGPRGGGAHAPHEHVLASSLRPRAQVALAVAAAALAAGPPS